MKTLFLHVGTPKTGTTAIQSFLLDNQKILKNKGYCYRLMPFTYPGKASRRRNAHFALEKVRNEQGEVDEAATQALIDKGYEAVGKWLSEMEHVILTDESYWSYMRGDNWKLLERFIQVAKEHEAQVKIIVYLRRQDEYMASWWKQHVREGGIKDTWENFLQKPSKLLNLNYAKQLTAFSEYVGEENVIVRRYEKGCFLGSEGTIYSDFLEAIGLQFTDDFVVKQEIVHESLDDNYAEIMRSLNSLVKGVGGIDAYAASFFSKYAIDCSQMNCLDVKYSMFSQEEQAAIWKKYNKSNEAVRKTYFPNDKELFTKKAIHAPKWTKDNPQMQEDIILYFGTIVLGQQQEMEQLRKQLEDTEQLCKRTTYAPKKEEQDVREDLQMQGDMQPYFESFVLGQQQEMEQLRKQLQDMLKQQNVRIRKMDTRIQQLENSIQKKETKIQQQETKLQQQETKIQQKEAEIKQLQQFLKQNKGELKIVIMILKPIKWIWWKMNDLKKKLFGKDKNK